ncbi:bifunctional MFS transporter/dTMP kinase [Saccharomonospora glauca]|uniref:Thymidylate kinase n=1 Tax=Saccharomonospora glauca K62 TaxID=928724 RepID=I1D787_9PSEU|nr:dTMP kinase [Saccharomonospora glauca]EIF00812.1 thymidylate kinase [Saccharomonospora glauca K62]
MGSINESKQGTRGGEARSAASNEASTVGRVRRVLAIRPFRRLWGVTYLCSVADWLSLLALTGLVTKLTDDYAAQNFAFAGIVLTQLLPGLLFAPLGGMLADRFDRRKIMIVADLVRFGLLISIAVVGTPLWLFIANFLVGSAAMMWIPSKDAAVPNLLRRRDQVETANQLGMVMTYGVSVVTGAGIYAILTGIQTTLNLPPDLLGEFGTAKIVVVINGLLYLASALLIARIPELSLRNVHPMPETSREQVVRKPERESGGFRSLVRDGVRFVKTTPLIRGLLIGMAGAFAAGGAVIGSAKPYSSSLGGGDASFGLLFVAVFIGAAVGLASAPKLARRLPHERLFGVGIVLAGLALVVVALAPHLAVALVAVALVGACAGAAFLTGITIIGTQIDDSIRGRINAIYQSLLKIIIFGTTSAVPGLIGLVKPRRVTVWGNPLVIDGTRPVLLAGGLLATLVGVIAYRQMDSRRTEPIFADLRNVIRRRPRRVNGVLIALEGTTAADTESQAARLAEWLGTGSRQVVLAADPALDDERLTSLISGASLEGARAKALAAAAVRADIVERDVRPALDSGAIVVMERFVDTPLAHLSTLAELDVAELEGLADWATGRLRPDLTVLLDADPGEGTAQSTNAAEHHWRVQEMLAEMAASAPDRYVVVDAEGTEDEVAERVRASVREALSGKVELPPAVQEVAQP